VTAASSCWTISEGEDRRRDRRISGLSVDYEGEGEDKGQREDHPDEIGE
jgi:hypothetical protein